ncbi:N-acetyltransferase, partial [Streptomyces sp. SID10244]|nr:N-acetyltransferase [Streptomyces sp. SID10244]
MIKYEWRSSLGVDEESELRDVLERAAAYDAEPEYNSIEPDELFAAMRAGDRDNHHLVIWMLPRPTSIGEPPEPERIAGIIRLAPRADGWADGTVVIDPKLRSIGIITLLLEQAG